MIDLARLREAATQTAALITKKDPSFDVARLIALDAQVRDLQLRLEQFRAEKNDLAQAAKKGVTPEQREKSKALSAQMGSLEKELEEVRAQFLDCALRCPNLPADDVPVGGKESNQVIKTVGEKPQFSFSPKHHADILQALGWIDFEAAARMTGSNFALYKGEGVTLAYALMMLFVRTNIKHGFTPILPPYLVSEQSLEGASNFPRFKNDVYAIADSNLYLTPTAEVNLTNMYRDMIFSSEQLPVRMTAWTSCFRKEAGGYGANERGLIRIHQFEKAELYTICAPEHSAQEQERMVAAAEDILQQLGLHYRISLLAAQDSSFAATKTYDIEVWMPGQGEYKEVSSVSNCGDFQARRVAMRYRTDAQSKTKLVHTLNGSSLALPRVMVALIETYQQADGSIVFPESVKKMLGIFS